MSNRTASVPVYFEESWSILSSVDLINAFFGLMIVGITSLSPLTLVPIVTSVFGAVANGLCYYAFYAHYPTTGTVVAAAVADISWLIQEAGMSFYSYLILTRVLSSPSRTVFISLFWTLMGTLTVIRILILESRARDILAGNNSRQSYIDHLHICYFSSIAVIECVSAFFLLRKFSSAKRYSVAAASTSGLLKYLTRSTEIRLTVLAAIGVSRAITYSFQATAQSATNVASQVDRFVYTLECLFPVMMFIDILASRLAVSNQINASSSQSRNRAFGSKNRNRKDGISMIGMYSTNHIETRVDASGQISSSQERIVDGSVSQAPIGESGQSLELKNNGISKTVEFEFHESAV